MSIVFALEQTNQLSLLPDKDLVDLCPPIEPYQVTKNLKFLAYLFTIITIGLGLWGLSPVVGGEIILPEQLLAEEWNQAEEEDYLTALIQYLQTETLVIISKIREQKAIRLNWAIRTIVTAVILFLLDEMIFISIPVLGKFCAGI